MNYRVGSISKIYTEENSTGFKVFSSKNMTMETYSLTPLSAVIITFEEPDRIHKSECHYLILEGDAEIVHKNVKINLHKGDIFSEYGQESFTVRAITACKLLAVHNMVTQYIALKYDDLIEMVHKVEENDSYLKGHNNRVGMYTNIMLTNIDSSTNWTDATMAAAVHDIGKIYIPSEILNKPGKLTDEEFDEIKKHPVYSWEILKDYQSEEFANLARWHHEKPNGTGYPDGLKGDEIPLACRVMAVADVFDALTTSRSYRKKFDFETALKIMDEDAKKGNLDEECLKVLKNLIQKKIIREGDDNLRMNDQSFD